MRIPRRGEVGWQGEEIERLEELGFVMSGRYIRTHTHTHIEDLCVCVRERVCVDDPCCMPVCTCLYYLPLDPFLTRTHTHIHTTGNRHKRMNAIRIRKENQVYTA